MHQKRTRQGGFSLIELMIVVAIIAIIAAIAIPGLLRARITSNETSAIGSLKSLSTAQEQFRSARIVDQDGDGTGEYGFFQELSGTSMTRTPGGLAGPLANPSFMATNFGSSAAGQAGVADKSGYMYLVYLPTSGSAAVREATPVPSGVVVNANSQETRWACYAWPTSRGNSGNRCFVVNQEGQVYQAANNLSTPYNGTVTLPVAGAAYQSSGVPANLDSQIRAGTAAVDTQVWTLVGG